MPSILLLSTTLLLAAGGGGPTTSPAPETAHRLNVDDVLATVTFTDLVFSADGRWLAWVERRSDEEANAQVGDLWRLDLRTRDAEAVRLTHGPSHDHAPRFSPDGRRLAFLSRRGGDEAKTQIWAIAPDGGEAEALTNWDAGVIDYRWLPDGRILFTAEEGETEYDRRRKKAKDDALVFEDREHWPAVRLFVLDREEGSEKGKVRRISDDDDRIDAFAVAPDGRRVLARHVISIHQVSQVGGPRPRYRLHFLDGTPAQDVPTDEIFDPDVLAFSADGKRLYAQWAYSTLHSPELRSSATISTLWEVALEEGSRERIDGAPQMGLAEHVRGRSWSVVEDGLVAVIADGVHGRPVRLRRRGDTWRSEDLRGPDAPNWSALAVDPSGQHLAVVHTSASEPEELRVGTLRGTRVKNLRRVRRPNTSLAAELGRSEPITWKSRYDGAEITGILHYPRGFEEDSGRRWPLMLWIHGGPTGVDADTFENDWASFPHLLADRGMFVLQPNYRGSANHGLDVVESITRGKYYEIEIPDILSGVDALIDRGWVHPDSLGTKGWSNGAILSIELTVETDRFRVACAGAGDVNWTSDFGNCAFGPNFDVTYLGSTPYEDPDLYVRKSPLFRMDQVHTPTLIQFGEKDTSVPTEQGYEHYRALQLMEQAPVRLVIYPGMGHGLRKLSYQRHKIEEDLAWIDRHLFGRERTTVEARRPGSPLDLLLARAELPRSRGAMGVETDGVLLPPVDPRALSPEHPVRLARTELTRGQLEDFLRSAAGASYGEGIVGFDPVTRRFDPAERDLPATGITIDLAMAYVDWLQKRTNQMWRLPTAAEWEAAAMQMPRNGGNDLCHWAGFAPTLDEAEALTLALLERATPASLLRPVASTGSRGDLRWYDLHGNAAEWTAETDGSGARLRGRCVLDACDEEDASAPPADPRLWGLRLALEVGP